MYFALPLSIAVTFYGLLSDHYRNVSLYIKTLIINYWSYMWSQFSSTVNWIIISTNSSHSISGYCQLDQSLYLKVFKTWLQMLFSLSCTWKVSYQKSVFFDNLMLTSDFVLIVLRQVKINKNRPYFFASFWAQI